MNLVDAWTAIRKRQFYLFIIADKMFIKVTLPVLPVLVLFTTVF